MTSAAEGAGRLRISIAMATRNGARFLARQLESIRVQIRLPDEMVVCDDASADATPELLRTFAANSPFPVRVERNDTAKGTTKNFERAIARCTGDVILLADQDDVWHPAKLERFESSLATDTNAGAMFTDATLIDEDGRTIGTSLWTHIGFRPSERRSWRKCRAFEILTEHNVVTGATLGFRSSLRDRILPIPDDREMVHDRWIALIIAATSTLVARPEALVAYRQHPAQQIGAGEAAGGVSRWVRTARMTGRHDYASWAHALDLVRDRLRQLGPQRCSHCDFDALEQRIDHLRVRSSLPANRPRRMTPVLRELVAARYHRYSNGLWSMAKDLLWR